MPAEPPRYPLRPPPPPLAEPPSAMPLPPPPPDSREAVATLEGGERRTVKVELAVMFFAVTVPGLIFGLRGVNQPQSIDADRLSAFSLLVAMASALGPALLAGFLLWRDGALAAAGFRRTRLPSLVGHTLLTLVGLACAVFVAGVVLATLAILTGGTEPVGEPPAMTVTVGSILAALAISTTAGVSEETIYRAYAITRMEQVGWRRAAFFVPWGAWTAQHLYAGPAALIVVGAVGIPFVWMFRRKRSVWPLMLAHGLYDIAVFGLSAAAGGQ